MPFLYSIQKVLVDQIHLYYLVVTFCTYFFFLILQVEADEGLLILEASGLLQYRITKDAIGKFVCFKCTPVRDDGCIGEPKISFAQERVRPGIVYNLFELWFFTIIYEI